MKSFFLITVLNLFFYLVSISGQTIADALPGCLNIDDMVGINCTGSTNVFFGINGFGQFEVNNINGSACCNVGGNHGSYFTFEVIDISSYSAVSISMDYSAATTDYEDFAPGAVFDCTNVVSTDTGHDQIYFAYILDGIETLDTYVSGTTAADYTGNWTVTGLNGNALQVKVWATNKAADEKFFFENLDITAMPASFSAGPDQDACNAANVNLAGTGAGNWSGGSGTFSDVTDPNASYMPGGADDNSMVTLTYGGNPTTATCGLTYAPPSDDMVINFSSPTAVMAYADPAFDGMFCTGDCALIDINVTGGTPPYALDMVFNVGIIPFPFPFPMTTITSQINLCYDPAQILPAFDIGTNTLTVPGSANGFTGSLDLNNISDNNACSTPLSESVSVTFNNTPEFGIFPLDPKCPDEFGQASFRLTDAIININPGGATISFYQNNDMTGLITDDPYFVSAPGETIYAFASFNGCISDPEAIQLLVLPQGEVGSVEFYCNGTETNCPDICDPEGDGEVIDLTIILEDPSSTYEVVISGSPNGNQTFTIPGGTSVVQLFTNGTTIFEIISISRNGTCPDDSDLGSLVEIDLIVPPLFDDPGIGPSCTPIMLPIITGINIPPGAVYFSEPNGMGATFPPNTLISQTDTFYLYGGVPTCFDQVQVIVTIGGQTIYDEPNDTSACASFILPEITGQNVGDSTSYYTGMDATGTRYQEGNIISSNTTLYIYDHTSTCQNNQPSFMINLSGGPQIDTIRDTLACGFFIFPSIEPAGSLSGGQAYYTESGAGGIKYEIGDTLFYPALSEEIPFLRSILYAFDSTTLCTTQRSFYVGLEWQGIPGISDTIAFCEGSQDLLNLPILIGGAADSTGSWSAFPPSIDLSDSTAIDISNLIVGQYRFSYDIIADSVCTDTSAFIRLEITDGPNPGPNASLTTCSSNENINLIALIPSADQGGVWVIDPLLGVDVSNPSSVDLSNATSTDFNVYYKIESQGSCPADSSTIRIILVPDISAGDPMNTNICAGAVVDLESLLINNSSVGRFEDVVTASVVPNMFNTNGLNGSFEFHHIVDNPVCPSDTTLLVINVTNAVSAGDDVSLEICNPDDLLNLNSLLVNADGGGEFFYGTDPISNDIIPSDFDVSQSFFYAVGDDITCPIDKSEISLSLVDFMLDIPEDIVTLCPEAARFVPVNYSGDREYTVYFTTTNTNTGAQSNFDRVLDPANNNVTFQVKNTDDGTEMGTNLAPNEAYLIRVDSIVANDGSGCVIFISESFIVNTELDLSVDVDTMICLGDTVFARGVAYTESVMRTETSVSGCITIIDVKIDYFQSDTTDYIMKVCDDNPITIGDMTFTPQFPSGIANIEGGRSTGCDSMVRVSIDFADLNEELVDDVICGSQSIVIGGTTYDANNLNGSFTAPGSNEECDTLITIALVLGTETIIEVDDAICDDEVVMVAGVVYSSNMPSGQEMVPGQGGACDTLYNVDLNVSVSTEGFDNIFACDPSEVFNFGSLTLDINNPQGTYIFGLNSRGCDSMVNVEVTYDQIAVDVSYIDPLCENDAAQIIINSVSSQNIPIMMELNGEMFTLTSFPIDFALAGLDIDLNIYDSQGCSFIKDTSLTYFPVDIFINTSIVQDGEQLDLISNVAPDQVTWTPSTGLSCSDCINPIANPDETTTYTVEVLFEDGFCSETLDVTVRVDNTKTVSLPNVLSLGSNPTNSIFYVKADPALQYQIKTMLIFDRWGNKVFSVKDGPINDSSIGWDGKYKGMSVTNGVYPYYIVLDSPLDGVQEKIFKGDITVVR